MLTNRETIYQVKKELKESYADSRLTPKFVYSIITKHAKWLVRRESNALKIIRFQDIYQTLNCVEVIEAPLIDPCCGIRGTCTIYRTKDKIPNLYEDDKGIIIKEVTSVDGSTVFTATDAASIERKKHNPWVKKYSTTPYYFYDNGYLYFTERVLMVKVRGLFLTDVSNEGCNKQETCNRFMDSRFILPDYLIAEAVSQTVKEIVSIYKQIPEDLNLNKNTNT